MNPADALDYQIELAPGDFGDPESGTQTQAIYQACAVLPPARGYVVVFDANVFTWDSYNQSGTGEGATVARTTYGSEACGTGYWDVFVVNLNQTAHYSMLVDGCYGSLADPVVVPDPNGSSVIDTSGTRLPGVTWAYGGACYGDGTLESDTGRYEIRLEGDSTSYYYLSVVLDTATTGSSDGYYPSWGTINDLDRCPADFDGDGSITAADYALYQSHFLAGMLTADMDGNGVLNVSDFTAFQAAAVACSE